LTFDPAQYLNTLTELQNANGELPGRILEAANLAGIAAGIEWGILDPFSVSNVRDEILNKGSELVDKITVYLEDLVELPFSMYNAGNTWVRVQQTSGRVGETLAGLQDQQNEWTGIAGGKYADGIQPQGAAADGIKSVAQTIYEACFAVAESGYAFLFALLQSANNVSESLLSADPGTIIGAVTGAIEAVVEAYVLFNASLGEPAGMLEGIPTLGGVDFPYGNWPIAAQP
jgi:hypothetical protein